MCICEDDLHGCCKRACMSQTARTDQDWKKTLSFFFHFWEYSWPSKASGGCISYQTRPFGRGCSWRQWSVTWVLENPCRLGCCQFTMISAWSAAHSVTLRPSGWVAGPWWQLKTSIHQSSTDWHFFKIVPFSRAGGGLVFVEKKSIYSWLLFFFFFFSRWCLWKCYKSLIS